MTRIAAGADSTCAQTERADVYCWGQNRNEQSSAAEEGFEPEVWTPRGIIVAQGSKDLVATRSTVCAIKRSGAVVCWGFVRDLLGEDYAKRSSGEVPALVDVTSLGIGYGYACALTGAGEVWCFGKGEHGELGGAPSAVTVPPRRVSLPGRATRLTVGPASSCARIEDGRWLCWGANKQGELGGTKQPVLAPTALDLRDVDMSG